MPYDLVNLLEPQNASTGVSDFVLIARESDFEADGIKCPAAPFTALGDKVTIKTAHVFKEGRGFLKFNCAPRKNKLDASAIGEFGFAKLDVMFEFVLAGSYAALHETVSELVNVPLIMLFKDSNCSADMYYQLGCDCDKAYIKPAFASGTSGGEGIKGYTIQANCPQNAIRIYNVTGGPEILA